MNIKLQPLAQNLPELPKPQIGDAGDGEDFAQTLMDVLKEVNASQNQSREKQNAFMTGQPVEIHDLMITMERASTTMALTLQVRNKVLEAYQEINRMPI
ncbi:MAG TPA: flagellar hook-basal body complex protein FliE [Fimbriimonadaceae bacterium]|nr:flagellar hook-basal body complex protein FliE [Fimbriimonadaceae bacterium]